MTEHERDAEASGPDGAGDETEGAFPATEGEEFEEPEEEGEAFEESEEDTFGPSAAPAAPAARRRERGRPSLRAAPVAPSVSEQAVRVNDRASAVFVLGMVGVFVAILLYGMLFGHSGFVTGLLATPTPSPTPVVTVSPSASTSPAASESPVVSESPSASPAASTSPAASASSSLPAASPSPSAS